MHALGLRFQSIFFSGLDVDKSPVHHIVYTIVVYKRLHYGNVHMTVIYTVVLSLEKKGKRVSIAFSADDNDLLYSLQQTYLYSGKSRANIWQLSDILKAIVVESGINLLGGDIEIVNAYLTSIAKSQSVILPTLPKDHNEFMSNVSDYLNSVNDSPLVKRIIESLQASRFRTDVMQETYSAFDEKTLYDFDEKTLYDPDFSSSVKTTAFILLLNSDETEFIESLRLILRTYIPAEIPFSTLIKALFRITAKGLPKARIGRINFLHYMYMGSLYDLSPVDSVLIYSRKPSFLSFNLSHTSLNTLRLLNRDLIIMQAYVSELRKEIFGIKKGKNIKKDVDNEHAIDLNNFSKNRELEDRFRSAIASFGFHSAFIGFMLLIAEWTTGEHKLPLLATRLSGYLSSPFGARLNEFTFGFYEYLLDRLFITAGHYKTSGKI